MNLDTFAPRSPKLLYHRSLLPTAKEEDKFINWQNIVTSYMSKDISFEKDRIPALAGLAAQMQNVGAGQYLGGLWRKNLLLDLLWISDGSRRRVQPRKSPTWSWVSTKGSYGSLFYHETTAERTFYPIEKIHARVVDIKWESSGQDLTRTDPKGALTLAAPLIEVKIHSHENGQGHYDFEVRRGELRAAYQPDIQGYKPTSRVFGLLIAVAVFNWEQTVKVVQALILEEVENEFHVYERIGSMFPKSSHANLGFDPKIFHPGLW